MFIFNNLWAIPTLVRIDGAEGKILGGGHTRLRQNVEEGRFADIRQSWTEIVTLRE